MAASLKPIEGVEVTPGHLRLEPAADRHGQPRRGMSDAATRSPALSCTRRRSRSIAAPSKSDRVNTCERSSRRKPDE